MDLTLLAVVVLALFFDYTNSFHDAADVIAGTVFTRALPPKLAVGLAGLLNFAGAFISLKVAATVPRGSSSLSGHPGSRTRSGGR